MKRISELSKQELLGLIYNQLPYTIFEKQPCCCVSCGEIDERGSDQTVYFYECDGCAEKDESN